jgi:hypothetical protein
MAWLNWSVLLEQNHVQMVSPYFGQQMVSPYFGQCNP